MDKAGWVALIVVGVILAAFVPRVVIAPKARWEHQRRLAALTVVAQRHAARTWSSSSTATR